MTEAERRRAQEVSKLQSQLGGHAKVYQSLLEASESEIVRFLTEAEHVITTSKNDKLLRADRKSLLTALGEAAAARLSINPTMGEAYLIPRKGKVDFQPGYKGLVRLAYRSGEIDSMHVDVAYSGEHYVRTGGTTPGIEHTPDDALRSGKFDDIVGAYAVVWLKGSTRPLFRAITKKTLVDAAEASGDPRDKSYSDVWRSHPEAMCFKTALIRVAKMLPRSDKFRDFHLVSERATLREVNVEPPPMASLATLDTGREMPPEPARKPLCSGKAKGLAEGIRRRIDEHHERSGVPKAKIWASVLRKLRIPALNGKAPDPEQLTVEQGKSARAAMISALKRLDDQEKQREVVDGEIVDLPERQPGEDDPRDVEPPADYEGGGSRDDIGGNVHGWNEGEA
jgi:phage RecT family recombinase